MQTREQATVPERRFAGQARFERRAKGETNAAHIYGRAIVYNAWTTLYESKSYSWREIIRPGAVTKALAEKQDVRCLFNHNANYVLGRTTSGTLTLSQDDQGVDMDCEAPDTQLIRDMVLSPMERQDITGQSFAFLIRMGGQKLTIREENDMVIEEREITDIDLFDLGPVTYPQYEETTVALRSIGEKRDLEFRSKPGRRAALMKFKQRHADALFLPH